VSSRPGCICFSIMTEVVDGRHRLPRGAALDRKRQVEQVFTPKFLGDALNRAKAVAAEIGELIDTTATATARPKPFTGPVCRARVAETETDLIVRVLFSLIVPYYQNFDPLEDYRSRREALIKKNLLNRTNRHEP
jgi:hypothetical protein